MADGAIRNVCILAHIDHGKTTVADCLLSKAGIINKRAAGNMRFLDDRTDEQSRGITMKSSAITLNYVIDSPFKEKEKLPVTFNLVDTPGHIDFSVEVTSALRLCDGALIVIDAVEGLCSQTKECIKKGHEEKLDMILIVNKIDRLITVLGQSPREMYDTLFTIITECNKYMKSLLCLDCSVESSITIRQHSDSMSDRDTGQRSNSDIDDDDSEDAGYFDIGKLNVIFASAIDGWGFTARDIAIMYSPVIENETIESIIHHLSDPDCYISFSKRKIQEGAVKNNKPNLFTQLSLSLLHYVYTHIVINPDVTVVPHLLKKLSISNDTLQVQIIRQLQTNKQKEAVKLLLEAWNPLSDVIIRECIVNIVSPFSLDDERIYRLINIDRYDRRELVRVYVDGAIAALKHCDEEGPTIAYISKVISLNKQKTGTTDFQIVYPKSKATASSEKESKNQNLISEDDIVAVTSSTGQLRIQDNSESSVMAFCRIFSGKLCVNQKLYLLNSKYNLEEFVLSDDQNSYIQNCDAIKEVVITGVYKLCARQNYQSVHQISAGHICGITIKEDIFHLGTLVSALNVTPLKEQLALDPIICNVIRPEVPQELIQLQESLRLLKQCDPSVRVVLNATGEYMLFTAGDVHLDKCLYDLKNKFNSPNFHISPPTYSLRETVIDGKNTDLEVFEIVIEGCKILLEIEVVKMPNEIAKIIEENSTLLKNIQEYYTVSLADVRDRYEKKTLQHSHPKEFTDKNVKDVLDFLKTRFKEVFLKYDDFWKSISETNIWRVTTGYHNINLLLNCVPQYSCNIFDTLDESDERIWIHNQIIYAFNMFCNAGPLCEEPLHETVFIINKLNLEGDLDSLINGINQHSLTQQLKTNFRAAFLKQGPIIMEPIMTTNITTDFQYEGRIFSEVRKRFGKVVAEFDLDAQSKNYVAKAFIPATESQGFANDIRKISSGGANPDLRFSHYEVTSSVVEDDEEDAPLNDPTRADRLIMDIRIRKGLAVMSQVVTHAEKQRTLKK